MLSCRRVPVVAFASNASGMPCGRMHVYRREHEELRETIHVSQARKCKRVDVLNLGRALMLMRRTLCQRETEFCIRTRNSVSSNLRQLKSIHNVVAVSLAEYRPNSLTVVQRVRVLYPELYCRQPAATLRKAEEL